MTVVKCGKTYLLEPCPHFTYSCFSCSQKIELVCVYINIYTYIFVCKSLCAILLLYLCTLPMREDAYIFLEPLSNFVPVSQLFSTFFRVETYFGHSGESTSHKKTKNKSNYLLNFQEDVIFVKRVEKLDFHSVHFSFSVLGFEIKLLRKHQV